MTPPERAAYMWKRIRAAPAAMVPWYLMASWLYYQRDISILPDEDYDQLCKKLLKDFDRIEHPHKQHVDREGLSAGTGFAITAYPEMAMSAASGLAKQDGLVEWNTKRKQWEALS